MYLSFFWKDWEDGERELSTGYGQACCLDESLDDLEVGLGY